MVRMRPQCSGPQGWAAFSLNQSISGLGHLFVRTRDQEGIQVDGFSLHFSQRGLRSDPRCSRISQERRRAILVQRFSSMGILRFFARKFVVDHAFIGDSEMMRAGGSTHPTPMALPNERLFRRPRTQIDRARRCNQ
jgi:hypothetical protein